jgi:hypothetical protein
MAVTRFQTGEKGRILIKDRWVHNVSYQVPKTEIKDTEGLPEEKFGQIITPKDDSLLFDIWEAGKATLYLDDGRESWDFRVIGEAISGGGTIAFQIQRLIKDEA